MKDKKPTSSILLSLIVLGTVLLSCQPAHAKDGFTRKLQQGMQGGEVSKLQQFLAQLPRIYPEGLITGFFGSLTKKAVMRFQTEHGLAAIGSVGSQTLAYLNQLFTQGTGGSNTPAPTPPASEATQGNVPPPPKDGGFGSFSSAPDPAYPYSKVVSSRPDHEDISKPLWTIRPLPPKDTNPDHEVHIPQRPAHIATQDALTAFSVGPQTASVISGLGFDGVAGAQVNSTNPCNCEPPDTNGSVGTTQYVQWVNTAFAVFDKVTGAKLYGPAGGNTFWSGFGGTCQSYNDGDPIIQFDKNAHRWIATQFVVRALPYTQCVAVSDTDDALGTYHRYAFTYGNSNFNDYPKLSVWPDGYYITYNIFLNGGSYTGPMVCAFDRDAMLGRVSRTVTQQCVQLSGTDNDALLPSDWDGLTAPPVGTPNLLLGFNLVTKNSLVLYKYQVDWVNPANTHMSSETSIPVSAFTPICDRGCIPQGGTTAKVEGLGDRLLYRLAYRNFGGYESMVVNHSVQPGTTAGSGVRWYELRNPSGSTMGNGTPIVYQQGTYAPDSNWRWMGSVAMDHVGNMAAGYSVSSASMQPAIRFALRNASDPLGTLNPETPVIAGTGANTGAGRWGDYSNVSVDPTDDCTMWYTTEYYSQNGSYGIWKTRVNSFKNSTCVVSTQAYIVLSPSTISFVGATGTTSTAQTLAVANAGATTLNWTASTDQSWCHMSPASGSVNSGSFINASVSVDPQITAGTYNCTLTVSDPNAANTPQAVAVTYTVDNTPPTTSITSPANGTTVSGMVSVAASASDNVGITKVELYKDGALFDTKTSSPYTFSWNTPADTNTSHTLESKAYDAAGNVGASGIVTVTVANPVPTAALSANPTSVGAGQRSTLTWSSTYATSCTGTNFSTGGTTSGSVIVTPTVATTYSVTCTGGGGTSAPASVTVTILPPPPNDNFANAQALSGSSGTLTGNNISATLETGEPNNCSVSGTHSIWYVWQPMQSGGAVVNTFRSNFDTTLGVYTGSSVSALTRIGCNDDSNGTLQSQVGFTATAGNTYYISINGWSGSVGSTTSSWLFDSIPPTTSITSPANGSTVSATTTVSGSASDNGGGDTIVKVELYKDGTLFSTLSTNRTSLSFSFNWYTIQDTNGTHTLQTKAYDAAGNVGTSALVTVTVQNSSDITPPTTSITFPPDGSMASGTVPVAASASDNIGVTKVELYKDGTLYLTDTTSPYAFSWDTTLDTNASHTLQTKAYDAAGNVGTSSVVTVMVSNTAPVPTASLSANPSSIISGQSSTLTWGSTNATSCTGTNFSTGGLTSGSISVFPAITTTYSVTCTGAGGTSATTSATVTVTANFQIGSRVQTTVPLNVRDKSNTNGGKILCTQPTGALGTIIAGPTRQQGYTWWNVNFDTSCDGWVVQTYLSLQ